MPGDLIFKAMNTAHRASMAVSGGRLGWTVADLAGRASPTRAGNSKPTGSRRRR